MGALGGARATLTRNDALARSTFHRRSGVPYLATSAARRHARSAAAPRSEFRACKREQGFSFSPASGGLLPGIAGANAVFSATSTPHQTPISTSPTLRAGSATTRTSIWPPISLKESDSTPMSSCSRFGYPTSLHYPLGMPPWARSFGASARLGGTSSTPAFPSGPCTLHVPGWTATIRRVHTSTARVSFDVAQTRDGRPYTKTSYCHSTSSEWLSSSRPDFPPTSPFAATGILGLTCRTATGITEPTQRCGASCTFILSLQRHGRKKGSRVSHHCAPLALNIYSYLFSFFAFYYIHHQRCKTWSFIGTTTTGSSLVHVASTESAFSLSVRPLALRHP